MLGCIVLSAQEIHLSLSKDTIGFNETVTLTLSGETNSDVTAIQDPKVDGVAIIGTYDNTDIDLNSGKVKLKRTYTLAPYKTGKFSMGPACVQIGSHRICSNKVSLVIVTYRQSGSELPAVNESPGSKDVFLRCETDKKKVVLGEQILVSLNLYRRVRIIPNPTENPVPDPFIGFYYYQGQITPKL
ncbi:MAG TPA: BatD family protein, partial [Bacteroidia bacterium]|nr:BatD family protein [Bacteroidia bacterium]